MIAAGENLKLGSHTSPSAVYVYAQDLLGNVSATQLSSVGTLYYSGVDSLTSSSYTLHALDSVPADVKPTSVAIPESLAGNGLYLDSNTLYYNSSLISDDNFNLTPSGANGYAYLEGYSLSNTGSSPATNVSVAKSSLADSSLSVYAVDYVGNVSSRYGLELISDTVAAQTFTQVTGDYASNSLFLGYDSSIWSNSMTNYYTSSDFAIKFNMQNNTPIVAYALIPNGSSSTPTDSDWTAISISASSTSQVIDIPLGTISDFHTHLALWIKDAVGTTQGFVGAGNENAIGNPTDTGSKWWMLYNANWSETLSCTIDSTDSKILYISGFSRQYPVSEIVLTEKIILLMIGLLKSLILILCQV